MPAPRTSFPFPFLPLIMAIRKTEITITGMSCGHCERSVKDAISELDGIVSTHVSHTAGKAEVEFDDEKNSGEQIIAAVNETGIYKAIA